MSEDQISDMERTKRLRSVLIALNSQIDAAVHAGLKVDVFTTGFNTPYGPVDLVALNLSREATGFQAGAPV